ncbi:MAG TPA: spermidine synthase [Planctomycetes bacterium]|nr:spermidine synthase [Planctomycetota bacterium]
MNRPRFEILDHVATPWGTLYLRRRELLGRPGTIVTEVMVEHDLLMSSLNTRSEEELATRAIAWRGGDQPLRVLVGGLGLGYTAHAALADPRVSEVLVIEQEDAVLRWTQEGLTPLGAELSAEPRLRAEKGDVYARLLGPAEETWDLILIDVDHTPTERLAESSAPFYTVEGLRTVAEHLAPEGVLAVWSAGDDDAFAATLAEAFPRSERERVRWVNELLDDGEEIEDVVFLAARPPG